MKQYYIDVRISGDKPEIQEMLELLTKIEILGNVGANRTIPVTVDGDGSARLSFKTLNTEENQIESMREFRSIQNFIKEVESGEDISGHYIGE